jgi:YHS domain-containing protein
MNISEQHAEEKGLTSQANGKTYYFCSKSCKKKFNQNPQQFTGAQQPGQKSAV